MNSVTGGIYIIIALIIVAIVMIGIFSMNTLDKLEQIEKDFAPGEPGQPPVGPPRITITEHGMGGGITPGGVPGQGACVPGNFARVTVAIGQGDAGNKIVGQALCGIAIAATAQGIDPGIVGVIAVNPVNGIQPNVLAAGCGWTYTAVLPAPAAGRAPSVWTVVCDFW